MNPQGDIREIPVNEQPKPDEIEIPAADVDEICGRRLIGDTGRYRHMDPCPRFVAAAQIPKRRRRGQHRDIVGSSYASDAYERLVSEVLGRVALGADVVTAAMADRQDPEPDRVELVRIDRERDQAIARYRRSRDSSELERTMARLDVSAKAAKRTEQAPALPAAEAAELLRNLPALWAEAPAARRALAESLFESIEVLGLRVMRIHPTRAAIDRGLVDAFHARTGGYGRGERGRARAFHLIAYAVPGVRTRIYLVVPPRRLVAVASRSA